MLPNMLIKPIFSTLKLQLELMNIGRDVNHFAFLEKRKGYAIKNTKLITVF